MKHLKKLLAVVLAFVFVVTALAVETPTAVYAAKTTTITMVKGEKFAFAANYYNVKSCSSSKKSVVTVKKNPDESTEVILTAKATGSSTVSIKTSKGTKKYTVKVVKNNIKVKAVAQVGSYLVYQITNNTSVTFDSFYFNWSANDEEGDLLKEGNDYVKYLTAKSTAYAYVYIGYGSTASPEKSTASADLTGHKRYPQYKYTDQVSKVKVTVTPTVDGNDVNFKVKFKSKVNEYVSVVADLILYDSEGEIVGITNVTNYLGKKETTTKTAAFSNGADVYDHYEVVVRAYSSVYSN